MGKDARAVDGGLFRGKRFVHLKILKHGIEILTRRLFMKWITRSHVHVDRVACPWLITRFVDNEAEFLFAPKNQIEKIVQETGAIPYDTTGVELGHVDGRCSF